MAAGSAHLASRQRMLSLDVLRGVTVAFMIMVNNEGDGDHAWSFMRHADWNGMTPTDLVFPTFLFVVGASIVFSFAARLEQGATRSELAWRSLRRAGVLFAFGLIVNSFPLFHLESLRVYGVLQRIAICYLAAALLHLWCSDARSKVVTAALALLGYWALLRWVPVPGYGVPGREIALLDPDGNLVAWIDRQIFSASHLYEKVRDPEGLLSNLPALASVQLGMLAGMWLQTRRPLEQKAAGLVAAAVALLLMGYAWGLWFPLNKKLWTSSYVLAAAGWSTLALAVCFWIVDARGWRKAWTWVPLVFGSNAIIAYMFSELLASTLWSIHWSDGSNQTDLQKYAFQHFFMPLGDIGLAAFAYSIAFTAICFVPVWVLYSRKIFVKV